MSLLACSLFIVALLIGSHQFYCFYKLNQSKKMKANLNDSGLSIFLIIISVALAISAIFLI
jgi:hypothetical protein